MGKIYATNKLSNSGLKNPKMISVPGSETGKEKPKCWRCGDSHVIPSTRGGNVQEFYYCLNCKEHFISMTSL